MIIDNEGGAHNEKVVNRTGNTYVKGYLLAIYSASESEPELQDEGAEESSKRTGRLAST